MGIALIALAFSAGAEARADPDSDGGIWGMVLATGDAAALGPEFEPVLWWLEGQVRGNDDGEEFSQAFVRAALGYQISPSFTLWGGYGWFRTSPAVGNDFDEHRIWQQLRGTTKLGVVGLASRTRLEQRFLDTGSDTGWRFRQRLLAKIPLRDPIDLVLNDEIFIHLNSTDFGADSGFDQNRFFVGLGWTVGPKLRFEVGYLNQFIERSGRRDLVNHILSMNMLLSP